jgi:alpha/beta superfamily hydrolase
MSKLPKSQNFFINGPAGRLEALLESPQEGEPGGAAVICHPHPEHGGTMQNKVAHTLARAFVARGFHALRFNFRGVGQSEGTFDEGEGEFRDALSAVQAMKEKAGDQSLWLAGFSCGSGESRGWPRERRAGCLTSVEAGENAAEVPMADHPGR